MKKSDLLLTQEGFEKLENELKELETTKRIQNKARLDHARSFCDFQEDFEYAEALKERDAVEERISVIQTILRQANIIEKRPHDKVEIGSTVFFCEIPDGEIEMYTIVEKEEADPFTGKISIQSPLAKRLLGEKMNAEVAVDTPEGTKQVRITAIS